MNKTHSSFRSPPHKLFSFSETPDLIRRQALAVDSQSAASLLLPDAHARVFVHTRPFSFFGALHQAATCRQFTCPARPAQDRPSP
jgi:hypothetical protein